MRPSALYLPVVALFEPTTLPDQIARQQQARSHLESISEALHAAQVVGIAGGIADGVVGVILAIRSESGEDSTLTALSRATAGQVGVGSPVLGVGPHQPHLAGAAARVRSTVGTSPRPPEPCQRRRCRGSGRPTCGCAG
ncbi:hypothetical protein [Aeromicrobium sp. UC242_57]|uniref:hypothetical protein n=1 Tax=Aeromicrobium sp. UC242_57 TaxID=3374624 RepID=UPI003798883D